VLDVTAQRLVAVLAHEHVRCMCALPGGLLATGGSKVVPSGAACHWLLCVLARCIPPLSLDHALLTSVHTRGLRLRCGFFWHPPPPALAGGCKAQSLEPEAVAAAGRASTQSVGSFPAELVSRSGALHACSRSVCNLLPRCSRYVPAPGPTFSCRKCARRGGARRGSERARERERLYRERSRFKGARSCSSCSSPGRANVERAGIRTCARLGARLQARIALVCPSWCTLQPRENMPLKERHIAGWSIHAVK
jgi:hypothetical protein